MSKKEEFKAWLDKPIDYRIMLIAFGIALLLLSFSLLIPPVEASITNTTGDSWIKWELEPGVNKSVYVDGLLYVGANTSGVVLISGLEPRELHNIKVYDLDNSTWEAQDTYTKRALLEDNTIYVLLIALAFMGLGLFLPVCCFGGFILGIIGGLYTLQASTEGWIILTYFLIALFSLLELFVKLTGGR